MPEWLLNAFKHDQDAGTTAIRLAVALVLGCIVAGIYRLASGASNGQSARLMATLVMLTVLIATVTLVIGDNQARAFSLVGALAIIRFRTVVEDTRDTAFVIFAVAVGMAVGAGFLVMPLLCLPFAAAAAMVFRPAAIDALGASRDFTLTVRLGLGQDASTVLADVFQRHVERYRLTAITTARQGAAVDVTYAVTLRRADGAALLLADASALAGVQNVELNRVP
jgi:hypothetical protein